MTFSEQLCKYRKELKITQEDLAEKCNVTRQAVAKWESGESIPDIYKISQIAEILNVSLEQLVWGKDKEATAKTVAKNIYLDFIENIETLKNIMTASGYSTSDKKAVQLRTEIRKARVVFPKKIVDELYDLTDCFGIYNGDILKMEKYKCILDESQPRKSFVDIIIPSMYERLETILAEYLDLPK